MRQNKRIGVKDIAERAGVSTGTVDRVLHQRGEVREATRQKVMAIVEELGYKPNIFARSLAYKKQRHIFFISPDSRDKNPYWEKAKLGVERAGKSLEDHNTTITQLHFDASQESSFDAALSQAIAEEPDGLVINPVFEETMRHKALELCDKAIPFVFFDVNVNGVGKLAYYGQDAYQSGRVAAQLMSKALEKEAKILIVKLSKDKVFSPHIEARIAGFKNYFADKDFVIQESAWSLKEWEERNAYFADEIKQTHYQGLFVPNTRVYKVASILEEYFKNEPILLGYDLIDENIEALKNRHIDYLISQRPEEQVSNAILALFNHLISGQDVQKTTLSPIDIIIKENIDYYG